MSSRATPVVIALGLASSLCLCLLALLGLGGFLFFAFSNQGFAPLGQATNVSGATPTPQTVEAMHAEMDRIEQQVQAARGWQATQAVTRNLYTAEQLRTHQLDYFEAEYSPAEARDDALSLAAFGLLDPNFDLYNFYIDLYSEGILGFYDPDVSELYLLADRNVLAAVERSTFAHEYLHALQDQRHGFDRLGWNDEAFEEDAQRFGALQAFMEGEAMLLESQWQHTYFTPVDWQDYNANAYAGPDSVIFRAPDWMQRDFYFPYDQGFQFVKNLYQRGGWTAVDEAYAQLPVSTEMILHLDKYDAYELPVSVPAPAVLEALDSGWRVIDSNSMGEWYTRLILEQHVDPPEAAAAAAGWGGDRYSVAYNDSTAQTVAAWQLGWDSTGDAEEFVDAFKAYGDQRFGTQALLGNGSLCWDTADVDACLYFRPQATLWILAPDMGWLVKVRSAIDF